MKWLMIISSSQTFQISIIHPLETFDQVWDELKVFKKMAYGSGLYPRYSIIQTADLIQTKQ